MVSEYAAYFRPPELPGVEALHARFVEHVYRPHSHPTWTVAVLERGAARFEVDETRQRADRGELFVLEPEAVHTGMAAVPEGWAYKVLYLEPLLLHEWAERDAPAPGPRAGWCSATARCATRCCARTPHWPIARPGWRPTRPCSPPSTPSGRTCGPAASAGARAARAHGRAACA